MIVEVEGQMSRLRATFHIRYIALVWKRNGVHCTFFGCFTMYYFTSTDFLIILSGFLSSLDFNNLFENFILLTKFWWAIDFPEGPFSEGEFLMQCLCLQIVLALTIYGIRYTTFSYIVYTTLAARHV